MATLWRPHGNPVAVPWPRQKKFLTLSLPRERVGKAGKARGLLSVGQGLHKDSLRSPRHHQKRRYLRQNRDWPHAYFVEGVRIFNSITLHTSWKDTKNAHEVRTSAQNRPRFLWILRPECARKTPAHAAGVPCSSWGSCES